LLFYQFKRVISALKAGVRENYATNGLKLQSFYILTSYVLLGLVPENLPTRREAVSVTGVGVDAMSESSGIGCQAIQVVASHFSV
jgi:hypothetical protein